jgi:hypothetical protein
VASGPFKGYLAEINKGYLRGDGERCCGRPRFGSASITQARRAGVSKIRPNRRQHKRGVGGENFGLQIPELVVRIGGNGEPGSDVGQP